VTAFLLDTSNAKSVYREGRKGRKGTPRPESKDGQVNFNLPHVEDGVKWMHRRL
jgi:hypothetical protein